MPASRARSRPDASLCGSRRAAVSAVRLRLACGPFGRHAHSAFGMRKWWQNMTDAQHAGARDGADLTNIRTDVVGSLLRPAGVRKARVSSAEAKTSEAAPRATEEGGVRGGVRSREQAGLDVVSD